MDSTADSPSVGMNTSSTGSHFPGQIVDNEKSTQIAIIKIDVDVGYGLKIMGSTILYLEVCLSWKKNHFGHWTFDYAACRNVDYADVVIGSRKDGVYE